MRRQVGGYRRRVLLRKIKEREATIAGLLKEWKAEPPMSSELRRLRAKRLKYERSTLKSLQMKAESSQQAKRRMGRIKLNRKTWRGRKPHTSTPLTLAMIQQIQTRAKKSGFHRRAFVNRSRRQAID
ncbi:hypothetical protein IQ216_07195 [Cyanobium sp. LEGE 06143]|uniref:hypothetical protein n=1 Tax=Cyanobium sp. LEGE 06143 TaxID=945727 RepID=UPI0018809FF7|nr:hypothetical protein [Cyanobium sp. LEGE 06143]MBE9172873.1 hypothetical protein [Cyanobium sp. LEGE 06143]